MVTFIEMEEGKYVVQQLDVYYYTAFSMVIIVTTYFLP